MDGNRDAAETVPPFPPEEEPLTAPEEGSPASLPTMPPVAPSVAPAVTGPAAQAARLAVAAKLLAAWLANRRQTLMPHTLNFRALSGEQVTLLIAIMAAAAQADGPVDQLERRQAALALTLVNADAGEVERHGAALAQPQPLSHILGGVRDEGIAAHGYAAALLAINRASPVADAFLAYVAARLALPPDLASALASRYRA